MLLKTAEGWDSSADIDRAFVQSQAQEALRLRPGALAIDAAGDGNEDDIVAGQAVVGALPVQSVRHFMLSPE